MESWIVNWTAVAVMLLALSLAQAADSPIPTRASNSTEPQHSEPAADPLDGPSLKDVPTWSELARAILLTAIPDKYEDKKQWGKTKEVFDGVRVQQRGFNIRVSEKKRTVNHGSWSMFTVRFSKLAQNVSLAIHHVESPGPGQFSFAIRIRLKQILLHGQFEQWVLGVKGLNFDVESDVDVQMDAVCQMAIRTEHKPGSLLPDLVLDPSIRRIRLTLLDVNTHHVGRIGGDIAEELGNSSRKLFEELMHSQEGRVLKKANEAIQKKRDSLRLPVSKLW